MTDGDLQKKLDRINKDFHQAISEHDHCYNRSGPGVDLFCHCEYYYKKWVDTKKSYGK